MCDKIALLAACLFGIARAGGPSSGLDLSRRGSPIGYGSGFGYGGYGGYGAGFGTAGHGYGTNFGYGGFGAGLGAAGLGYGYGSNLGYGAGFGVGYGAGPGSNLGYINYATSGLGPDDTETRAYQFSINHPLSHGAFGSLGVAGYGGFGNGAYGRGAFGNGAYGIGVYGGNYGSW